MKSCFVVMALCLALSMFACSPTKDGPTPSIESVTPVSICTADADTAIQITGSSFTPAVVDVLKDSPQILMPEVWLKSGDAELMVPTENVTLTRGDGESPDVLDVVIPAGYVGPTQVSDTEATFQVKVVNPSEKSDTWDGLIILPPPCFETFEILGIDPPFGWTDAATTVTIMSDGVFVSTPSVQLIESGVEGATPIELLNEAFIDASTITAQVPAGTPVGIYDVVVQNPPSVRSYGIKENGFEVVSEPIPSVANINPNRANTNDTDIQVTISGADFRDPILVELIDVNEQVAWDSGNIPPEAGGDTIIINIPAQTLGGFYLVRVTNTDQGTYTTYSGFVVTAPSANLDPPNAEAPLTTGRRMLAGVLASDPIDNRFLYAIGGDTGDGGQVLDTVELSQLSKFGVLGEWREQKYTLNTPRVGTAATTVRVFDPVHSAFIPAKTYIYVTGGKDNAGTVLDSVERALVLSPEDSPTVSDIDSTAGDGLEAGTWYYKVSAVMDAADADNPGGESLPSDEVTISLGAESSVTLTWDAVSGAISYRIYRTDAVDGSSQTEHLIASDITGITYTDNGDDAGTEPPLFTGSTGQFVTLTGSPLSGPKWGHAAHWAHDDAGNEYIYILGGVDNTGTVLADIEYASIDANGNIGAFGSTNVTVMTQARAFFGSVVEETANVTTLAVDHSRIIVVGGILDVNSTDNATEQFDISTGGGNTIFVPGGSTPTSHDAAGMAALIFNEKMITAGGAGTVANLSFSNCQTTLRDVEFEDDGRLDKGLNSSGKSLLEPRSFGFAVPSVGFAYIVGGTGDGTNALTTTERLIYK